MTKLFALGAAYVLGGIAALLANRRRARRQAREAFETGAIDEPVIVSEEVVVVTDAGPYAIDMEMEPR